MEDAEKLAQPTAVPQGRSQQYVKNVLWSWLGVAANLFIGLILSPYIIRKVGSEGYGIWALLFATVGYYIFLDMGVGSATQHFTTLHRARQEPERVNEIVNTALAYFCVVAVILLVVTFYLARSAHSLFQIPPEYHHEFSLLILVVGASVSLTIVFGLFQNGLEAFQRFDLHTRVTVTNHVVRAVGCFAVLAAGQGLFAMVVVVAIGQMILCALSAFYFRQIFPGLKLSPRFVEFSVFKKLIGYAAHTFVANLASLLLNYTPAVLIGNALPVAFVGYYNLPQRLLQYAADAVDRVGHVTAINSTELLAQGDSEAIFRLAVYANRYCLVLFMPLAIFLLAFGPELLVVWVGREFAEASAPLLPVFTVGTILSVVAQFNSSTILFGVGSHQKYAAGLLAEAVALVAGTLFLVPRFGILGVAWLASGLMLLNRGLFTAWVVCQRFGWNYFRYLGSIYARPLLIGIPVGVLAVVWKQQQEHGGVSLVELLLSGLAIALLYFSAAFFVTIFPEHRRLAAQWASRYWKRPAVRPGPS